MYKFFPAQVVSEREALILSAFLGEHAGQASQTLLTVHHPPTLVELFSPKAQSTQFDIGFRSQSFPK